MLAETYFPTTPAEPNKRTEIWRRKTASSLHIGKHVAQTIMIKFPQKYVLINGMAATIIN